MKSIQVEEAILGAFQCFILWQIANNPLWWELKTAAYVDFAMNIKDHFKTYFNFILQMVRVLFDWVIDVNWHNTVDIGLFISSAQGAAPYTQNISWCLKQDM